MEVRSSRLKGDAQELRSVQDLHQLIQSARANFLSQFFGRKNVLVLLGHVEGMDYVVRTPENIEQLRVPIAEVRRIARMNGVSLIDIGCKTVKAMEEEMFGLGVMTEYHSVSAVKSLEAALTRSKSFGEFLENMGSEDLKLIMEPSFVRGSRTAHGIGIYRRFLSSSKEIWVKVAEITMTFF